VFSGLLGVAKGAEVASSSIYEIRFPNTIDAPPDGDYLVFLTSGRGFYYVEDVGMRFSFAPHDLGFIATLQRDVSRTDAPGQFFNWVTSSLDF
jgi:hypothetical protein